MLHPLLDELQIVTRALSQLSHVLKESDIDAIEDMRAQLRGILIGAATNAWVPSWIQIINRLGGRTLHGNRLLRRVEAILGEPEYKAELSAMLIEGIRADLESFVSLLTRMRKIFDAVGITADVVPAGKCEIGVLFPASQAGTIDDLARDLHELDRHLRTFTELGGSTGGLPLRMLQTASFDIFVLADPTVGSIFAGVLVGIVKLLKSLAEIRKLQAETKKINAEAADLLSKQASALREKGLREVGNEAMSKAVLPDVSRANELSIATRQAVTYIESKIQLNVVFEVSASQIMGTATAEDVEGAAKSLQQIRDGGNALAELVSNQAVPLLAERGPADR